MQRGQVLLSVLVLLVAIGGSAATFIWFMNQQQTRAGNRFRSAAALNVAEAGIYRALGVLETAAPDTGVPGREWRPQGYTETVRVGSLEGKFALSIDVDPGGARVVTSVGEVAGVARKIRVRAYLSSPALLAAINGAGIVKVDAPPASTFILAYGARSTDRPWVHIMAGRAVWFSTSDVAVNNPRTAITVSPGPVDPAAGQGDGGKLKVTPLRIALARGAILAVGAADVPADPIQLRAFGVPIDDIVSRPETWPELPAIDKAYFQALAAANKDNSALNIAAGRYTGDQTLERNPSSEYSGAQFLSVIAYLAGVREAPRPRGVIYVHGIVAIPEGARIQIDDGTLVTESTVHLSPSSQLSLVHTAATRTLPALLVLDLGKLNLAQGARLQAHGLVYVNRSIEAGDGATFDVVGAVLGNDPGLSFRTSAATTIIRYDPAVLGTPGLLTSENAPSVVWIASWEEVP